jgi:membrane glycosyltransferase
MTSMPNRAELAMPTQDLKNWSAAQKRPLTRKDLWVTPYFVRSLIFGLMLLITLLAAWQIYEVVKIGGVTPLEWAFLLLFLVNFSWIALAFTSSIVGFFALVKNGVNKPLPVITSLNEKTAVVMPIYNESPARVFGTMQAIIEDVLKTPCGGNFDFYFLSDTTIPDVMIAEERTYLALRELMPNVPIFYRHRAKNTARKAGNIADFVTGWGGHYAHMLVLDADSVMTGGLIVALAAQMESDPDSGIIQTLPRLINRNSLLARLQQFAARIYGPIVASGLSYWMGRSGNYWGHNAIIRMEAFANCAGLPHLSGKPPFGGHIMSHDFIEAALIRRAGYSVYMMPFWEGSYEESPPSLMDLAVRDRRWCQGNLQHARILPAKGLHWATRQHLATGIMAYVASPLWLLQLLIGLALALQARFIRPEYFTHEFAQFPAWPIFDSEKALWLFVFTMAVLLTPKTLGLLASLIDTQTRRASGGGFKLTLSAILEVLLSALLAPLMMVIQSSSVFSIIFGRDAGWNPQSRDDGTIPLRDIIRRHYRHVLFGLVLSIAAFAISPYIFAWMSSTLIGLLLAVPLSYYSSSAVIGKFLKRHKLLLIPEESKPPVIAERAIVNGQAFAALDLESLKALEIFGLDASFADKHAGLIQTPPSRERGKIDPDRAIAEAKLVDAETIEEATKWLTNKEKIIVLHDRALVSMMTHLKHSPKL